MAVTIRDVAEEAGVSKTTAVHILNNVPHFKAAEATRVRVVEAATRLGYRRNAIASALTRGRIHTIGVVLPLTQSTEEALSLSSLYAKEMLVAIAAAAHKIDLRITLIPLADRIPVSGIEVSDGRVDGLILVQVHDPEQVRELYASDLPCVAITAEHSPLSVRPDNRGGIAMATEHLISLGHRRILHRANPTPSEATRERQCGFLETIERHGLNPADCPIVRQPPEVRELLSLPAGERPTAIVAFNDAMAIEVARTARQLGLRIPQDLSIVGFDNFLQAALFEPPLTTIHNPITELAEAAVTLLQALWQNEMPPVTPPLPTRLIVRASTAPPPDLVS